MTVPRGLADMTLDRVPLGQRVARSWVLLFGLIPEPTASGCRITDHHRWRGRTRAFGAMYQVAIPILFRHRHRQLRRLFGGAV